MIILKQLTAIILVDYVLCKALVVAIKMVGIYPA